MLVELITEDESTHLQIVELASRGWVLQPRQDNLDGWDSLAPRAEAVKRPQLDGSFMPYRLLTEHRVVTIAAHFIGATRAELRAAIDDTAAMVNKFLRLVVTDGDTTQHAWGYLSARAGIREVSDRAASISLIVSLPDPLKYAGRGEGLDDWESATGFWAEAAADGGLLFPLADQSPRDDVTTSDAPHLLFTEGGMTNSVECVNRGQAPSWPILEATGPFEWCQWQMGAQVVRWEAPVAAGDTLRINTQSGEILVGDFPGYASSLALDEFFSLPPGESVVSFQASDPARYRVRWLSAWL